MNQRERDAAERDRKQSKMDAYTTEETAGEKRAREDEDIASELVRQQERNVGFSASNNDAIEAQMLRKLGENRGLYGVGQDPQSKVEAMLRGNGNPSQANSELQPASGKTIKIKTQKSGWQDVEENEQTKAIAAANARYDALVEKKLKQQINVLEDARKNKADQAAAAADNAYARKVQAQQQKMIAQQAGMIQFGSDDYGNPTYIKGGGGGRKIRDRYSLDAARSPVRNYLDRNRIGFQSMGQRAVGNYGMNGGGVRMFIKLPAVMATGTRPYAPQNNQQLHRAQPYAPRSVLQSLMPGGGMGLGNGGRPPPATGAQTMIQRLMPPKMGLRPRPKPRR